MRRLGLPLDGISFPGHFLVRLPVDDGILVMDPYNRAVRSAPRNCANAHRRTWADRRPTTRSCIEILAPATHRMILARMLRNLKACTWRAPTGNGWRAPDRLLKISPEAPRPGAIAEWPIGN